MEEKCSELDEGIGESETDILSTAGSSELVDRVNLVESNPCDPPRPPASSCTDLPYNIANFIGESIHHGEGELFVEPPDLGGPIESTSSPEISSGGAGFQLLDSEMVSGAGFQLLSQDSVSSQTVEVDDIRTPQSSPQVSSNGSNSPVVQEDIENMKEMESASAKESQENWDLDLDSRPSEGIIPEKMTPNEPDQRFFVADYQTHSDILGNSKLFLTAI